MSEQAAAMATSNVIMTDIVIYTVASLIIIYLLDGYAAKQIGDRRRPAYRYLQPFKGVALLIVGAVSVIIGFLCLMRDLTVSRYTLTYFGIPYFMALLFYMVRVFRCVKSEKKRRQL